MKDIKTQRLEKVREDFQGLLDRVSAKERIIERGYIELVREEKITLEERNELYDLKDEMLGKLLDEKRAILKVYEQELKK